MDPTITWLQCGNTNLYIGVDTRVETTGAIYADVYIKSRAIYWNNSNSYTFKVVRIVPNRENIVKYMPGVVLIHNADTEYQRLIGTIQLGYLDPNTSAEVSVTLNTGNSYENIPVDGYVVSEISDVYVPSKTKCIAPTNISVSPSIITPTGSFSISWSGAKNGLNNLINKYRIYYVVSEEGIDPVITDDYQEVEVSEGATSGNATLFFTINESQRGYKIVCKIQAINSNEDSVLWSTLSTKSSSPITINNLPDPPTISITDIILASISSGQLVTAAPGSTNNNGQLGSVYYIGGSLQTKQVYSGAVNINPTPGSELIYEFYTFDGLEYSEPTLCSIKKNTKPIISQLTTSQLPNQLIAHGTQGSSGDYFLGWVSSIALKISGMEVYRSDLKNNYLLKWAVEMQSSEDIDEGFALEQVYSLNNLNLNYGPANLGSVNADTAVENRYNITNTDYKYYRWRVKCILNDGIEDGDPVYYPVNGQYYAVPGMSEVIANFNRFNTSDITGTIHGHMFDKVRFKLWDDNSTDGTNVIARIGNTAVDCNSEVTIEEVNNQWIRHIDVTLSSPYSIPGGSRINFTISYSNSNITKTVSTNMTTCLSPFMSATSCDAITIKPFTGENNYTVSIRRPFGGSDIQSGLLNYECGENRYDAIKLVQFKGNNYREIVGTSLNPEIPVDSDTMRFTIGREIAYKFDGTLSERLGITEYSGITDYWNKITITNLYGATYESEPIQCYFNFNEPIQSCSITSVQVSNDEINWSTFTAGTGTGANKVQEGMYLRFNVDFSIYTEDKITLHLRKDGNYVKTLDLPPGSTGISYASDRNPVSNSISIDFGQVGEVISPNDINWTIEIYNSSNLIQTNPTTTLACEHTEPDDFMLIDCELNSNFSTNHKLDYEYSINDTGCDVIGSLTYVLSNGTDAITGALSSTEGSITCLSGFQIWDSMAICVRLVSTCSQTIDGVTYSNTKTFYSNYIVVFQATPTIAYRKNHLGINTKNPSLTSIIDLYQTTGKEHITFHAKNVNDDVVWDMQLPTGIINYTVGSSVYTLDLKNVATKSLVSKTANGLCPQLPNETTTTKYLRQDGSWTIPPFVSIGDNYRAGNTTSSGTNYVTVQSSIGNISLSSDAANNFRGIWLPAHGTDTVGKAVISVDTNNNIIFNGGWSGIRTGTISLSTTWSGNDPYTQVVNITGATSHSKIDLQFTAAQLSQLINDEVLAITIENNNGVFTVYSINAYPTVGMNIQCTITEV